MSNQPLPSRTLRRALPFALLGLAGVLGLLRAPGADALQAGATQQATPHDVVVPGESGSVLVDARLESTTLLAGGPGGETYARIVLEGKEVPRREERLPLALTIVIDQSGSMTGDKIVSARESALSVLDQLQADDRVSVVAFSTGARVLVPSLTIGRAGVYDLEQARAAIRALPARGGTDMVAGLTLARERALALYGEERVNRVLLLSDGQPDTEAGLLEPVKELARRGVLTTTLGVGRDYNEDLMARLADAGLGNYWFIESATQMASIFTRELDTLASVVAKEAVVTIELQDGGVQEIYGWNATLSKGYAAIPVGDIYAGKKAEILVRLRAPAAAAGESKQLVNVKVSYHDALTGSARRVERPLVAVFSESPAAVAASLDLGVTKKAEEVRTAAALVDASEAYSRGDHEAARRIYTEQKQRVESFAAVGGAAFAPAAAEMAEALDELDDVAASKGDMAVAKKKAKSAARAMRR